MAVYLSGSSEAEGEKFKLFSKEFVAILGLRVLPLKNSLELFGLV